MIKTLSEEQGQLGEVTQMLLVQEKERKKKKGHCTEITNTDAYPRPYLHTPGKRKLEIAK